MLERESPDHDPLAARKRSRRIIAGLVIAGIVAYVAGLALDRPLLGVGVYWTCCVAFVGYEKLTDAQPYDERDLEVTADAAGTTLSVAALALIAGAPGMAALEAAGAYTASETFWGAMFALAGLFGVFALAMAYHDRRT